VSSLSVYLLLVPSQDFPPCPWFLFLLVIEPNSFGLVQSRLIRSSVPSRAIRLDGANDQKQEKRSKARSHLDPSHPNSSLPQSALLFNYQSSENSTSGSDSSDSDDDFHQQKVTRRKEMWESMRNAEAGPSGTGKEYGWGMGLGMKVLEVRTPSWRSEKVS